MGVVDGFRLDGKVAVVTGASRNVGLEITRAFAEAGATVVGVARDGRLLEERLASISVATGARVIPKAADVMDSASTTRLVEDVHREFDAIDVLVNNAYSAGGAYGSSIFEIPDEDFHDTFAGNVLGPYRLCRGFGRRMMEGRGGSIVNVLSGSGFLPVPGVMPYGATKAALWMMTRYLAVEAAPKVRVNGLCPGLTMSETGGPPMNDHMQALLDIIPMGRAGHPAEVASAALYLASDAAAYTTGALLVVNGGRSW
jgi:NAD(P)-dependent dehydrogenase (short-subunit alcohol dehydrogenase family)